MGSVGDKQPIHELTALERIGPKGYLRYVFPFPLQEGYDLDEVARVLRTGYHVLTQRIPEVTCEALPDPDSKQRGVMKLQIDHSGAAASIVVKDLRDSYPSEYAELKSKSFPVSSFDADLFCRRSVWPSAGERLPISLVQANFIRGGVILSWCILHLVGDGTSFYTWTKIWADGCREAQGLKIPDPIQLSALWMDRETVMKPSGRNSGALENHPEYTLLPFTPTEAPPKMISPNHRGQIFYFSPESLSALKADASPANTTEPSDQQWVSTNDALSALLWRTVMAVQWPLETLEGDPISTFNIAIDGRLRTDPKVHPDTLGCFLEYVAIKAPIRKMLKHLNIADLAVSIRKAILKADDQFTDDVVTLIDKIEDVDRLLPTAFLDVPGFNCVQTSWLNFELYGLDWGSLLGNKIDAVRVPHVGTINGLQVVLPVLPNGGMEVVVGVEESCLNKLLNDPLFTKYGVAR
ncbi:Catabolic 3-dehydroquinase [Penicillium atrosanguineum]|uniref:Catabolic 3-dehydroquinase n=1 Tax=Penicillium atrosanguineum TaxID=1132637 RepID=UPI00238577D9|nr:Catabolic 3-dehydroquinase [Penicillium atrosanguineum]KAJ5122434.1 Transferase [Penicillium atrosanguineum]KAJ5310077.1 Catabolic 3-dehydroquinase [Penicillium atrosanguineum]